MSISQSDILSLNLNGSKSIDFQKEALAKNKEVLVDSGKSKHDFLDKKLQLKNTHIGVSNADDLYEKIMELKKSGMLKNMLKKANIDAKYLSEDAPLIPMNSDGIKNNITIKNNYPNQSENTFKYKVNKKSIIKKLKQ